MILVTPFMLIMAVVQAAIDNKRLAMNINGAIVSYINYTCIIIISEFLLHWQKLGMGLGVRMKVVIT